MKRSEAVKSISEDLEAFGIYHDPISDEPASSLEIANYILKNLEELGMLPPTRNADLKSEYGYARVNEWEKENA